MEPMLIEPNRIYGNLRWLVVSVVFNADVLCVVVR